MESKKEAPNRDAGGLPEFPGTSHFSSELTWPRALSTTHPHPPVPLQKEAVGTSPSRDTEQAPRISKVGIAIPTSWIFITSRRQSFITKLV